MTILRRGDLTFRTRRAQVVARFVTGAKASQGEVERWLALWDAHAARAGIGHASPAYWDAGLRWIAQRRDRRPVA